MLSANVNLTFHIEAFLLSCRAANLSPRTVDWYAGLLMAWAAFLGARDWRDVDLSREFIVRLQTREQCYAGHPRHPQRAGALSPFTVRGYVRSIKRFANWMLEEGRIQENPLRRLKMPRQPKRLPRAIEEPDFERMLAAAGCSRDRALILILRDTGCRVSEVAGLKLQDVDLEKGMAFVLGKGQQERFVFLKPRSCEALRHWLEERGPGKPEEPLFLLRDGGGNIVPAERGAFKASTVYQVLKRTAKGAGVEGRSNPHSFRHGFGRDWVLSDGDISPLADIMGHSDLETTRIYLRFRTGELQELHRRHSPVRD